MAISLSTEAGLAGKYPAIRFNQRERKLLESVKAYVDSLDPAAIITTQGDLITGNASGSPLRLAKGASGLPLVAGAATVSYAALSSTGLASGSVTLAKLAAGITPSHIVVFAGKYTTLGGSATEAQTVSGVAATDVVIATLAVKGGTPRTILTTAATLNTITYVFSGDPSTDHVVSYMVLRAAS